MQLIDQYEPTGRGILWRMYWIYGIQWKFNHAIMIRSFLSKNNVLYYQAGAGVVAKSKQKANYRK
jgi:anthranilate synthase component 1